MKNILIAVVAVLVFNAVFVYSGGLELLVKTEQKEVDLQRVSPAVLDVFRFTLEEEVRKKTGTPIEGYEPQMFLNVFPGLVASDFEGVEASSGAYTFVAGTLTHKPDDTQLQHSATGSITRTGYETLLTNVAARNDIVLQADGTVTDVMRALVQE